MSKNLYEFISIGEVLQFAPSRFHHGRFMQQLSKHSPKSLRIVTLVEMTSPNLAPPKAGDSSVTSTLVDVSS